MYTGRDNIIGDIKLYNTDFTILVMPEFALAFIKTLLLYWHAVDHNWCNIAVCYGANSVVIRPIQSLDYTFTIMIMLDNMP